MCDKEKQRLKHNAYMRDWSARHPDKIREQNRKYYAANKEKHLTSGKKWARSNRMKCREISRRYRANHLEERLAYGRHYRKTINPKYGANYTRERARRDENFRLRCRLRKRIWAALKTHQKSCRTSELLGCSTESLWIYLESRFEEGMTRQNYGSFWEVDHILPCALFDLSKPDHQYRCFHFSNLQPLSKAKNRPKGSKILVMSDE